MWKTIFIESFPAKQTERKKEKDIIINGARPKPIIIHTKKKENEKENPI